MNANRNQPSKSRLFEQFGSPAISAVSIVLGILISVIFYLIAMRLPAWRPLIRDPESWLAIIAFFWAAGELYCMNKAIKAEEQGFKANLLSTDPRRLIQPSDMQSVFDNVRDLRGKNIGVILANMIEQAATKYQTNKSVPEVTEVLRFASDLNYDRLQSSFSTIRYLAWGIPVLGFIGTVRGLSNAMGSIDFDLLQGSNSTVALGIVTDKLGTAFYTTLIALILSFVLMFFIHRAQSRGESMLQNTDDYCLKYFLNKLFDPHSTS